MAYTAVPNPALFRESIRSSVAWNVTVDATRQGVPVAGAQGLQPVGGTITDTTKPGVRRVLNLELAPEPSLFDLLAPIGTTLKVTAHVRLTDRTVVNIPMGVFDIDEQTIKEGGGSLSLTAPDKWVRIKRARFVGPAPSYPGVTVVQQLTAMIRDAMNDPSEPVNYAYSRDAWMADVVWEKDRDTAMIELAKSIGVWVYFDRDGIATIADVPRTSGSADWLIDSGPSGVLTALDRSRSRTNTYNVVLVSSSNTDGEKFPAQLVWDDDPNSPTYAGTDPAHATNAGPFGISTLYFDTPIANNTWEAIVAGRSILSRVTGLASAVSLGAVPNHAIDAFDVLDVIPPGSWKRAVTGYSSSGSGFGTGPFGTMPFGGGTGSSPILGWVSRGAVVERHVVDTVVHPLVVGPEQQIQGRSTRFEELEGTS